MARLRATFDAIRESDAEAQERFTSAKPSADPLEAWRDVLSCEDESNYSLAEIQTIAAESIPEIDRGIWKRFLQKPRETNLDARSPCRSRPFQLELARSMAGKRRRAHRKIATRLPKDL